MAVISTGDALIGGVLLSTAYVLCLCIYRLFLSPIAHIPGPTLAKLTFWYEFYYDAIKRGQYVWKIDELHKKYGPIVQVSPEEVHIRDPDFYDEIYSGAGKKRNKWLRLNSGLGMQEALLCTTDHDLHRKRRGALNPFFSKQKVRSLQPDILVVIETLMNRFEGFGRTGEPLSVTDAFAALTYDVVYDYSFGFNRGHISKPDFAPGFRNVSQRGAQIGHVGKAFPWLLSLIESLPDSIALKLEPDFAALAQAHQDVENECAKVYNAHANGTDKSSQATIFHEVINNPNVPESEKLPKRLWQDGYVVVVAGTLTTADALSWSVYAMLTNPESFRKLKDELLAVMPHATSPVPTVDELEKLPYLVAVIAEALRLSNGVTLREPLIDPERPMVYTGKDNKQILFPNPHKFMPERWILGSNAPQANPKHFAPFLRGSRMCLGINLAYAEMYLTLATIFRRYGSREVQDPGDKGWLELFDFDFNRDLKLVGDGAVPLYSTKSRGVRVTVRK
ncbi:N-acetyltryptophan 6-hydroxylase ivoC [Cladobotryum mycophilum]|uniref:N-acetyltryptophan 6-hydroxylase ivoC n=1 Tax=Cladobotryum mycophilum TaxID=491253 RepID=A0ABR0SXI9_9HYPO